MTSYDGIKPVKTNKRKSTRKKMRLPSLQNIKSNIEKMTEEQFVIKISNLIISENLDELQSFFYYLILFRDLESVHKGLNSKDIPIEFLEKLFMFTFVHCTMHGYSTENIVDNMLYFLTDSAILRLLQESKFIKNDRLLMFYLLTRLDVDHLNVYFSEQENLIDVVSAYYRLPEDIMKSIIVRNYKLFEYIMMMLLVDSTIHKGAKTFIEKHKKTIEGFSNMSDIIMRYHTEVDLATEGTLPFNDRDMKRISFLVNTLRSMPDREKAIKYFANERVFVDEYECKIVAAMVSDPLLKDTFMKAKI